MRELPIGEAADPDTWGDLTEDLRGREEAIAVTVTRPIHVGPTDVLLTVSVDLAGDVPSRRIERVVTDREPRIRKTCPAIKSVFRFQEVRSHSGHEAMVDGPRGSEARRGR